MSSRYDSYFWQLRDLQRTLDSLRPQLDLLQTIPPEVQTQIEQLRLLEEQFTLPSDYLNVIREVQRSVDAGAYLEGLPALAKTELPFLEELHRQRRSIDTIIGQFADHSFHQPISNLVFEVLVPVEALLETHRVDFNELGIVLQSFQAFQNFAAQQVELASKVPASVAIDSRLDFVAEACDLLENMVKGFELGALIRHNSPFAEPSPHTRLSDLYAGSNLFVRLQQMSKDVDFESDKFDAAEFVRESCEGKLSEKGYRLVKLVHNMNVEAELEGKERPFKPTTNTLHACGALPFVIAQDEETFSTIVDQLYFLLYEGTGCAKRLVGSYGTVRLSALWRLKHLRLMARHDVEHGSAADIRAKRENIGKAFKEITGLVFPKNDGDWCRAQLTLYEQLIEMLESLWRNEDSDTKDSEAEARDND